ncbi:GNAT family N-acetyltransferase [Bacillus subtilis]|uniref:GNAT family N-acetyltransferase n=1 Tax=Pseudochrobactrum asaccharolyticum TaxID=354351 RepID=UPI001F1A8AF5|nr:GNAT family N-acetyltransferase [Pseudochrobactrum asaccharolyticum]MCF7646288.1 GNAT family N-acetyltransferase [Pseudochrobactrum asaccharolyticum]MCF7673035.1 GNAT family N-acetyltransferase [Bacillus subtilis]
MLHLYRKAEAIDYLKTLQLAPPAEQNIFNHPDFLRPALEHFATDNCGLLTTGSTTPDFLMPFQVIRAGLGLRKTIYSWSNLYATQGTPLINAHTLPDTLEKVLTELSEHGLPDTLVLPDISLDGVFAQALNDLAQRKKLPLQIIRHQARPVLLNGTDAETYLTNAIGKNHHRDYRRLWRRLSETGKLEHHIATDEAAIIPALEDFLSLEASGWKSAAGTAFLTRQQDANFARQAVHAFASKQLVQIHALKLDDKTIASLVVFISGDQAWTWKTAYDETLRAYSPGVLLMIEVLKNHLSNPVLRITDSCAIPDHPVMSRLFHERANFGTLILGLTEQSQSSVNQIIRQLNRYDRLRMMIRNIKARLRPSAR